MGSIHGFWFILIGTIVVVVSLINSDLLIPFIFVGAGFILYGSAKISIKLFKDKKEKDKKKDYRKIVKPQQLQESQTNQQKDTSSKIFLCKRCGNRLKWQDNFCSNCGVQLKD